MTSITDTQVINVSGGLVELGYVERTTDATSTATTLAAASNLFSTNLTFVADGSPVMVEFFCPRWVNSNTSFGKISLVNGSGTEIGMLTLLAGSSQEDTSPKYRYTPSAGLQTLNVKMVSYDGTLVTLACGAGGYGTLFPMFLRVSKIVQATQWPAVTTGIILCTSSTRPASPYAGQEIYETDTAKKMVYTGTTWVSTWTNANLNAQTGTTYTLVLQDALNGVVTLSNASAITCTVPPNSSVAFPVGASINLLQLGAGQVTVAAGAGVTLSAFSSKVKIAGQYGIATLLKTATDTWVLFGNTST
jgi:hypothetical protein